MNVGQRVRRENDGQLGFLVEDPDTGRLCVRLDRGKDSPVVPYSAHQWTADTKAQLTPMQAAQIAYAADQSLMVVRGSYSTPVWREMKEPERIRWMKGPPADADDVRKALYRHVLEALKGE